MLKKYFSPLKVRVFSQHLSKTWENFLDRDATNSHISYAVWLSAQKLFWLWLKLLKSFEHLFLLPYTIVLGF